MSTPLAPPYLTDFLPGSTDAWPAVNFWNLYGLVILEMDFGLEEQNGELEYLLFETE